MTRRNWEDMVYVSNYLILLLVIAIIRSPWISALQMQTWFAVVRIA